MKRAVSLNWSKALGGLQVGRLNHVAIAVPSLGPAVAQWEGIFGAAVSAPLALPEHGVTTVFVELPNVKLELLEPLGEKSPIHSFLAKSNRGGIHHVCLEVPDILAALKHLKGAGVRLTSAEPRIGAHGKPVLFCHPADTFGVLVELEQV